MAVKVVKLPDVGEGVAEAELVEWHVNVGDEVAEDQVVAAVMTDKATVEIPSPFAGKVVELGGETGTKLAIGAPLIRLDVADALGATASPPLSPSVEASSEAKSHGAGHETSTTAKDVSAKPQAIQHTPRQMPAATVKETTPNVHRPLASPAVRRRALDLGIDLRLVPGTGPAERISHEDLDTYLRRSKQAPRHASRHDRIEEIRVTGLRRAIAERITESSRRIAHFSYIEEVDVTALEDLRKHLNDRHAADRPRLTLLPFLARSLVVALRGFPQFNALYDDEGNIVTRHSAVHLGIATQTPTGLMVPVLRDAGARDLWESAAEIRRLADAARDGTAGRDELTGSTISITSLGELGGLATTPIINRPEVAIVGVNKIAIRPVWADGHFIPRKMMNLSSSFDHRVIDGHEAAQFVQRVKQLVETPAMLFIEAADG